MGKGWMFLTLSMLSILSTTQASAHDCTAENLYQPKPGVDDEKKTYYICQSPAGTASLMTCPEGLYFNPDSKGCGFEKPEAEVPLGNGCTVVGQKIFDNTDTTCQKYKLCGASSTVTDESCADPTIFVPSVGDCVSPLDWSCNNTVPATKPNCNTKNEQIKYYPVEGNCAYYYQCVDTVRVRGACPTGTHLDFASQMCISESKSTCKAGASGSTSIQNICIGKLKQFVADPNLCTGYYYCIKEDLPYWGVCDNKKYFSNGSCISTKPKHCTCEDLLTATEKITIASADPTKYIICEATKAPIVKTCPSGLVYSAVEESCISKTG